MPKKSSQNNSETLLIESDGQGMLVTLDDVNRRVNYRWLTPLELAQMRQMPTPDMELDEIHKAEKLIKDLNNDQG